MKRTDYNSKKYTNKQHPNDQNVKKGRCYEGNRETQHHGAKKRSPDGNGKTIMRELNIASR